MAGEDAKYSAWIRLQPCAMCDRQGPSEQHHARGPAYGTGVGLRAHDWYSMPLCHGCHHDRLGKMPKAERRAFEFDKTLAMREKFLFESQPPPAPCGERLEEEVF